MTIATFYNDVRTAIGRGAANDASFPGWAQEAISLIENSHTFTWMQQTNRFPVVPGIGSSALVLDPRIKAIKWAKFGDVTNTGTATEQIVFHEELTQVTDVDITSYDNGEPTAFYWDGVSGIIMDALVQVPATLFVRFDLFTQWPTDTSKTPSVLMRHYQAFKAIFMMIAATNLRDVTLNSIWAGAGQTALQTLIASDTETQWSGRRGLRMGGSQDNV